VYDLSTSVIVESISYTYRPGLSVPGLFWDIVCVSG